MYHYLARNKDYDGYRKIYTLHSRNRASRIKRFDVNLTNYIGPSHSMPFWLF